MQQQKPIASKKNSITEMDITHFKSVVERTCKYTLNTRDGYTEWFFEIGWTAVSGIFKEDKAVRDLLLKDTSFGFWPWMLVEYVSHDEKLHNSEVEYRYYEKAKRLWVSTLNFYDALDNFLTYKKA
jgi:hypothetical protein